MDMSNGKKIQVDVSQQPNVECEECKNIFFEKVTVIKKISKLLVGAPDDQLVPMETYACKQCGHINDDFDIL